MDFFFREHEYFFRVPFRASVSSSLSYLFEPKLWAVLQSGQLNLLGKPYLEESACHFSNSFVKPCAEHYFDSINRMSVIESSWIDPTRISDGADGDQPWPSDKVADPTAKTLFGA